MPLMSQTAALEVVIQKARELQNKSLNDRLPEHVTLWNGLLSNEIADLVPAGIAILDEDFKFSKCNRLYREYVESYSRHRSEAILGKSYLQVYPGAKASIVGHLQTAKDSKTQGVYPECPLPLDLLGDDLISYWDSRVVPLKDDNGRVSGILIFTTDVTKRVWDEQKLRIIEMQIEELKTTLRTVVNLREEDNRRLEQKILANAKTLVLPLVSNLKNKRLDTDLQTCLDGIEAGINALVSDFSNRLGSKQYALTPKEIKVAALIKAGKTTKEIAECFHLSTASIEFHRKNIRAKLGLNNKSINMQSYLMQNF